MISHASPARSGRGGGSPAACSPARFNGAGNPAVSRWNAMPSIIARGYGGSGRSATSGSASTRSKACVNGTASAPSREQAFRTMDSASWLVISASMMTMVGCSEPVGKPFARNFHSSSVSACYLSPSHSSSVSDRIWRIRLFSESFRCGAISRSESERAIFNRVRTAPRTRPGRSRNAAE